MRLGVRAQWIAMLVLAGCSPNRPREYVNGLASADRAWTAGRSEEAAQRYDAAARETSRPMDHEEAIYRAGQAWERAGNHTEALARFDWLAAHGEPEQRGARGALEAARIRIANHDYDRAEHDLLDLAVRAPNTGPSRRGLELIFAERDDRDPTGERSLAWITEALAVITDPVLRAALFSEQAHRLQRSERLAEALQSYQSLMAIPFPTNTHWDDGGLGYAELLVALHRARDAVSLIDQVLAVREIRFLQPGSAERPHFGALQAYRSRILRDELHDLAAAADSFHRLYVAFPDSLLRDDALAEEAAIREQLGQHDQSCQLYGRLAREFPCTRNGRRAVESARACHLSLPENIDAECRRSSSPPS